MAQDLIELRSDTFTLPTPAMLAAIADAKLGDDGYGEDPTVRALEHRVAGLLGKEAACLVPSGTMANLVALLVHCPRGFKAVVGDESDIFVYEAGGAAVCGGVVYEPLPNAPDGTIDLTRLRTALSVDLSDAQFARPALVCLESPQSRCGGMPLRPDYVARVRVLCDEHGVALHLDGARLFNGAAALGTRPAELAASAHSVQVCLSKSVGAPVGSVLAGDRDFVDRARRTRKMLGGGMRQAGVIAAPALVALDGVEARLERDHEHAHQLAAGLGAIEGVAVVPAAPRTNSVVFAVAAPLEPHAIREAADRRGVRLLEFGHGRLRAMTHAGIGAQEVARAVEVLQAVISSLLERVADQTGEASAVAVHEEVAARDGREPARS